MLPMCSKITKVYSGHEDKAPRIRNLGNRLDEWSDLLSGY